MKNALRTLFSPILNLFENSVEEYSYQSSHRLVLLVVGVLFTGLATGVFFIARGNDPMYYLPVVIFGGAGLLSLIIGLLGNDRAVAKIWGNVGNK